MDPTQAKVVYLTKGMDKTTVRKDTEYRNVDGISLKMDVYYPPEYNEETALPAVVFAHGEAPGEFLQNAKEWGQYTSWGQIVAASGLIGVTFTHRSSDGFTQLTDVSTDIEHLLGYIDEHSNELFIDKERMGVWVCSAGGPACLSPILRDSRKNVKAIAAYYTLMNLEHIPELREELGEEVSREFSPTHHLKNSTLNPPPMLVVKAGLDKAIFNDSIDEFIHAGCLVI